MNASENRSPSPQFRLQFSIGTLLLWIAIVALAANSVLVHQRLASLQIDQRTQLPLSAEEVAKQFASQTTLGPINTTVKDVRYSPQADAYRVQFSWKDAKSGKSWFSDVELENDGFGIYHGRIRNSPFIDPLGYDDFFYVAVEKPSPLAR